LELVAALDAAAGGARARRQRLDKLFDSLCEIYMSIDESERRSVRAVYQRMTNWRAYEFWRYRKSYARRFGAQGDPQDLRRALFDASLADGLPDPRDAVVGFSLLSQDARKHGVDADPIFHEVAAVTNPDDPHSFIGPLGSYMVARAKGE